MLLFFHPNPSFYLKEICTLSLATEFAGDRMTTVNFFGLVLCLIGISVHVVAKATRGRFHKEWGHCWIRIISKPSNKYMKPESLLQWLVLATQSVYNTSKHFSRNCIFLDWHWLTIIPYTATFIGQNLNLNLNFLFRFREFEVKQTENRGTQVEWWYWTERPAPRRSRKAWKWWW